MEIGTKTWTQGEEITITTEPYKLYGGWFQDGVDGNGKAYTIVTPEQKEKDVKHVREEWKEQQAAFKRVRELSNG